MFKKALWRGMVCLMAAVFGICSFMGALLEQYRSLIDANLYTHSSIIVTEDDGTLYSAYVPDDKYLVKDEDGNIIGGNSEALVEAHKDLGRRVSEDGSVLLKNNGALPLATNSTVTLLGMRSYDTQGQVSQSSGYNKAQDIKLADALKAVGISINETMLSVYENLIGQGYATSNGTVRDDKSEPSVAVMDGTGINYKASFSSSDTAIVSVGRGGGEGLSWNLSDGSPLALTPTEKEILQLAKDNFDKVVVLINTGTVMEINELKNDEKIDSIMWIGLPGNYGTLGVANILAGKVAPSGGLADIYATDTMSSPGMVNYGTYKFTNADEIAIAPSIMMGYTSSEYVMEVESIYVGYRYYETRYYDSIVNPSSNASSSAGVFASSGNWDYTSEVAYSFGYGMSYTTFEETLGSPKVTHLGHTFTLEFPVTVKNTGSVDAKRSIQIYAQAPYTTTNVQHGVEKSAVSLVAFEKTPVIKAGDTYKTTIKVDMQDVASWDEKAMNGQGSYILDAGDYYFAVGSGAHDALNNMLAKQGKTVTDGMDYNGDAAACALYTYTVDGDVDEFTFNVTKAGGKVQNQLDFADWNKFEDVTQKVTYLSRSDWQATWPVEYTNLTAAQSMMKDLYSDTYELKTNDDTSDIIWNQDNGLTVSDMIGASFDDPRWELLLNQLSITEAINMACMGGQNFNNLPSIGFMADVMLSTDGPGGIKMNLKDSVTPQAPWTIAEDDANANFRLNSYSNGVVLASTFNPDLMYEEGELTAIDGLFVGMPIFWGVGANIHRTPYGNRNGEYYSEDPVLTGIVSMEFVMGSQSYGLISCAKHIAFYDQGGSHGQCVFMNEQRAREIELRAFQIPFECAKYDEIYGEDVGMLGTMTAFNKLGTIEMTCNKAVLTDIMRGEWGFNGYTVSDGLDDLALCNTAWTSGLTCYIVYMPGSAGNNLYPNATEENYKNDRTMLLSLRENVKRNMYVFANSNYMNGFNKTSHSVWQWTWWRQAYIGGLIVSGVLLLASAALYVVSKKKED